MTPHRSGNEPDPGDMTTDPDQVGASGTDDLPDDEAEQLGDFA